MYERKKLAELQDSLHQWEETTLKKASASLPERRDSFLTTSSEPINRLYPPLDVPNLDYHEDLGHPGLTALLRTSYQTNGFCYSSMRRMRL